MAVGWRERARLRPAELAEVAGVSLRTVTRAIESGALASYREGRCRFVPITAALDYVGEHAPDLPAAAPSRPVSELARRFVARLREARP